MLDKGQSHAAAAPALRLTAPDPVEFLKDPCLLIARDADPRVRHRDSHASVEGSHLDAERAPIARVLDGVVYEVGERLLYCRRIHGDVWQIGIGVHLDLESPLPQGIGERVDGLTTERLA